MIHKFKALGLALVAILAMSAFATSAASALEFTATNGNYPVNFSGTQPASEPPKFTGDGYTTECNVEKFSGTLSGKSSTIEVTPTYEGCTSFGISSTVTMNGCKYWFHISSSNLALVSLICPLGKEVTIHAGTCVIHIPPYTAKSHALITNVSPRLAVKKTVSGISMSYTDAFLCPFTGNTTTTEGTLTGGAVELSGGEEGIDVG